MLVHTGSPRALGVHGFIACRWSIDSAGRLACHWEADKTGGGRKPGVGDHRGSQTMSPVEMRTTGVFPLSGQRRWIGKRLSGLSH
jgi:hypothetical protein